MACTFNVFATFPLRFPPEGLSITAVTIRNTYIVHNNDYIE